MVIEHTSVRSLVDLALSQATITRDVRIAHGALKQTGEAIATLFAGRTPFLVADETTWRICGPAVVDSLQAAGLDAEHRHIFPATPTLRPDTRNVAELVSRIGVESIPIAIGSGTLNDLVKRAAFEAAVPYAVIATAPSMDGYTASGAALIANGVKQTFPCPAPELVIADLDVLINAPAAMISSGYGDLIGKVTAGADWILADALGIEPMMPEIWQMVQGPLRQMIAEPGLLFQGEPEGIENLFYGLLITGLAIQAAGTTRCASGSEHQFSHYWEMRGLEHHGELVSHGHKVALGTVVSTSLYEALLEMPIDALNIDATVANWPTWAEFEAQLRASTDPPAIVEKAVEECRAKYVDKEQLRERLATLQQRWPQLQHQLVSQLLLSDQLVSMLREAQCPTAPEDIGLTWDQFKRTYLSAGTIRRRYTVFDVLLELGELPQVVDTIFGPGGFWSTRSQGEP